MTTAPGHPSRAVAAAFLASIVTALLLASPVTAQTAEESPEPEVLGAGAAFSLQERAAEYVRLEPGTLLFARPDAASERLLAIDAPTDIEVLERRGEWRRIRYDSRFGWVNPTLPENRRGIDIPLVPAPLAVDAPRLRSETLERLRIAREILGVDAAEPGTRPGARLGPYRLLTDVREAELLDRLGRIASGLPASYRERTGLAPSEPEEQTVVLFRRQQAYRRFEAEATDLEAYGARGHASADLAVLHIDERDGDASTALLVHELTHLMNRSTLGATPPPWLEEGIANDLAYCRVDRRGRVLLGTLNGDRTLFSNSVNYTGALASLSRLLKARARRQATPLEALVDLDQEALLGSERRSLHYVQSAFLVRFLLETRRQGYAEGFRRFLQRLGAGENPGAAELAGELGEDWERIERRFDRWLELAAVELLR